MITANVYPTVNRKHKQIQYNVLITTIYTYVEYNCTSLHKLNILLLNTKYIVIASQPATCLRRQLVIRIVIT